MTFLYPAFLFALVAISIPIIIHLFNFRRYKTIYFSNVAFLENVKKQTRSKSQIKNLLILLMRILVIAALVLAFAQPVIPVKIQSNTVNNSVEDMVCIYVDNSFSMDAESKYGKLMEVAKSRATTIVSSYNSSMKFCLITNDFEARHNQWINKEQMTEYISEIKTSPVSMNLNDIYSRALEQFRNSGISNVRKNLFVLSDYQKTFANFNKIKTDSGMQVFMIPLATQQSNNLYVDSCWFENPSRKKRQNDVLMAKIINKGDENYQNIPIKMYINDSVKSLATINIGKNSDQIVPLSFIQPDSGIIHGRIEITDYPIIFDNKFYFSYHIAKLIRVLVISNKNENPYLKALFTSDPNIEITFVPENSLIASDFPKYNVILLDQISDLPSGIEAEMHKFLDNMGTIAIFPDAKINPAFYYNFFQKYGINNYMVRDTHKTYISEIDFKNELFQDVFKKVETDIEYPFIKNYFKTQTNVQSKEMSILKTRDGQSAFSFTKAGKGRLFTATFALDPSSGNFAQHSLFVPIVYNLALFSLLSNELYTVIGEKDFIEPLGLQNYLKNNREESNLFKIKSLKLNKEFIPRIVWNSENQRIKVYFHSMIHEANNFNMYYSDRLVYGFSMNYDRKESEPEIFSADEIIQQIRLNNLKNFSTLEPGAELLSNSLEKIGKGKPLWRWFLLLALIFLAMEVYLINYFSKNSDRQPLGIKKHFYKIRDSLLQKSS